MGRPLALALYLFATNRSDAIERRRVRRDAGAEGAYAERLPERLGQPGRSRPGGKLIWADGTDHSALAALAGVLPRLADDRGEDLSLLLTTPEVPAPGTFPAGHVIHQLTPAESGPSIARFLDHWRPDLAVVAGGPLRPALISGAADTGVPIFLLTARIADLGGSVWETAVRRAVLPQFDRLLAASEVEALALRRIVPDEPKVDVSGPLREGGSALDADDAERDRFAALLEARPVWVAALLAQDELPAILAAHRAASRISPRLLLVVVPERPDAGLALAVAAEQAGWVTGARSAGATPAAETQVYIADLPDELGLWYRLAPIAFLGGTLLRPGTPANPFDAAALGSAILHGPHLGAHEGRFDRLSRAGAARLVRNGEALGDAIGELLAPERAAEMAQAAWAVSSEGAEVADQVSALISDALDRREAGV